MGIISNLMQRDELVRKTADGALCNIFVLKRNGIGIIDRTLRELMMLQRVYVRIYVRRHNIDRRKCGVAWHFSCGIVSR